MNYLVVIGILFFLNSGNNVDIEFGGTSKLSTLLENNIHSCRHGWQKWEHSCFMYSEDKEPWVNAEEKCRILGGHLLEIHDNETNLVITDHLKAKPFGDPNHRYWIGLTEVAQAGSWEWLNSASLLTFSDWYPGQPKDNDEHCVDLYGQTQFKWHDGNCDDKRNYICMAPQI